MVQNPQEMKVQMMVFVDSNFCSASAVSSIDYKGKNWMIKPKRNQNCCQEVLPMSFCSTSCLQNVTSTEICGANPKKTCQNEDKIKKPINNLTLTKMVTMMVLVDSNFCSVSAVSAIDYKGKNWMITLKRNQSCCQQVLPRIA